jgi:hypothetical protein
MSPLVFKDDEDDIAVSVFSFAIVDRGTPNAYVKILGRYPARANECQGDDQFDPFDWKGGRDGNGHHMGNGTGYDDGEFTAQYDAEWDNIRGYVFRGNHSNDYGGTACLGSTFSTAEVEEMLDFSDDPDRVRKMEQAANYGVVLVEIFWSHKQLLGLPWMNFGPIEEGSIIHVWTFFPVSEAEPNVEEITN